MATATVLSKPLTPARRLAFLEAELKASRRMEADLLARIGRLEAPAATIGIDPLDEVRRGLKALRNQKLAVVLMPTGITVMPASIADKERLMSGDSAPAFDNYDQRQERAAVRAAITMLARLSE